MTYRTTALVQLAAFLTVSGALSGMASANTKTTKSFSGWQVECVELDKDKSKTCIMSEALLNAKTKKRVMSMLIRKTKEGKYKIGLQVPQGADLGAGVLLALDASEPVKIAYKVCLNGSCLAEFDLTEDWSGVLGKGKNVTATITGLNKETAPFKLELKGFAEAYAYLLEQAR